MKQLLCAVVLAVLASAVTAATSDDAVLVAREAFKLGDRAKLARQLDAVQGNELEPYVQYWLLRLRLEEAAPGEISDFLNRYPDSLVAERLRGDWLKVLGRRQMWDLFDRAYPALAQPDLELTCYALQSRVSQGDGAALNQARPIWFSQLDMPDSCAALEDQLVAEGRLKANDVWQRIRRLVEAKRIGQAKQVAEYLPATQGLNPKALDRAVDHPQRYLERLAGNFAATRPGRELAMYAVVRLARSDPREAFERWQRIKGRYSPGERGYVFAQLGWQGALRHLPEATSWYEEAGDTPLSDEQLAWKARAALRALDWRSVHDAIESMPEDMSAQPVWCYWLGRAHAALGRREEARALYRKISGQPNFYGNLSDDELGIPIAVPPKAPALSAEEMQAVADNPSIQRALALYRLDMRIEAVREWNWALRGMDDRSLLAAAEVARRAQIIDRSITAADKTRVQHDYSLRYPAPFLSQVQAKAQELQLDSAWVYGLMRQESRFVTGAKSSVGARGLMQVMPKTAAWVARKLGLKDYHPTRVGDMDMNVTLGTGYLKMVLEDLDNHPVLASAAYNAGPGRARKWCDIKPLEGAIYAETIPFAETREYVKKVMSNYVYYSALFEGKPQSLKARLGIVAPRGANERRGEDLP